MLRTRPIVDGLLVHIESALESPASVKDVPSWNGAVLAFASKPRSQVVRNTWSIATSMTAGQSWSSLAWCSESYSQGSLPPSTTGMTDIIDSVEALIQRIQELQAQKPMRQRLIVAVAGAPGSGKSTLAAEICQRLNQGPVPIGRPGPVLSDDDSKSDPIRLHQAVVVPMDGFHLDNAILQERGQIAVKGSPQTFDVEGFANLLRRFAESSHAPVYIPVFDRSMDLSRNAAHCVDERHEVVIVEGNYLLLKQPGWQQLAALFHLAVMLDVPMETLRKRLVQRWLDYGHDPDQALERALSNDIPNANVVIQESSRAHLIYKSVRQ